MKMRTSASLLRQRPDERMGHFSVGAVVGFLLGVLFVLTLSGCSASYTISSPECPPDDSLSTARHPLGCGIYMPRDTSK